MKTKYKVDGMTCGGCANSVTRAITTLVPGATVDVNLEAGTIPVEGVDDEGAIAQAVEDAGFDFGGRA